MWHCISLGIPPLLKSATGHGVCVLTGFKKSKSGETPGKPNTNSGDFCGGKPVIRWWSMILGIESEEWLSWMIFLYIFIFKRSSLNPKELFMYIFSSKEIQFEPKGNWIFILLGTVRNPSFRGPATASLVFTACEKDPPMGGRWASHLEHWSQSMPKCLKNYINPWDVLWLNNQHIWASKQPFCETIVRWLIPFFGGFGDAVSGFSLFYWRFKNQPRYRHGPSGSSWTGRPGRPRGIDGDGFQAASIVAAEADDWREKLNRIEAAVVLVWWFMMIYAFIYLFLFIQLYTYELLMYLFIRLYVYVCENL